MIVTVEQGGAVVAVRWPDGFAARFHAIWLLDNAPTRRDPGNGQKRHTVLDLPADPRVVEADGLRLTFAPCGTEAAFSSDWLRAHSYDREQPAEPGWLPPWVETWDASHVPLSLPWSAVASDRRARKRWLAAIRSHGVARLSGVSTHPGAVAEVAEVFGYVRETNYGRVFDVRAKADPNNLADTALGLAAHTDNAYRDPVPTLQLLLCHANDVAGGESRVMDGFAAALDLRDHEPAAFATLCGQPASWAYAGAAGVRLSARRPMVELAPDGELRAVRHNDRSAAPLDVPFDAVANWYAAARSFAALIERPDRGATFRLAPGDLFIVDNTRVLHARTAFAGGGDRWLQGCYADRDGLLSTLAALEDS